jgi:S-adenosyl methyltransferase
MTIPGIDTSRPNVARVCDALLGGRDNYAADREQAERLLEVCPSLRDVVRENRTFVTRAVTWAAQQGLRQFADLGTGMPAQPSAGDAARAVIPAAQIAYIDHDVVVTTHLRALLADDKGIAAAAADLTDPAAVLACPEVRPVIDPAEPVCLVFGLVLNLLHAGKAREVIAGYADLAAPGSLFVVSCGRIDDAGIWDQLSKAYTAAPVYNHTREKVAGFFGGLELVDPGLVPVQSWRGGWQDVPVAPPGPACVLGAVARKPAPRRARGLVAR